ncbi:MAG: VirB8/TrbF family protein [Pseudomonadota bacterium]
MNEMIKGMQNYVTSEQYFIDARKWYNSKYIHPLSHRSIVACSASVGVLLLVFIFLTIQSLLPLTKQLKYSIFVNSLSQQSAQVTKADQVANNPLLSIAQILIEDYIKSREQYTYDKLDSQMQYVQKTSTRMVFKKYFDYFSMDNVDSPVIRYQKEAQRKIFIDGIKFLDNNHAEVKFTSTATDATNKIFENISWLSFISFETDDIVLNKPAESAFNFVVTDYKIQMLGDKNAKN